MISWIAGLSPILYYSLMSQIVCFILGLCFTIYSYVRFVKAHPKTVYKPNPSSASAKLRALADKEHFDERLAHES